MSVTRIPSRTHSNAQNIPITNVLLRLKQALLTCGSTIFFRRFNYKGQ